MFRVGVGAALGGLAGLAEVRARGSALAGGSSRLIAMRMLVGAGAVNLFSTCEEAVREKMRAAPVELTVKAEWAAANLVGAASMVAGALSVLRVGARPALAAPLLVSPAVYLLLATRENLVLLRATQLSSTYRLLPPLAPCAERSGCSAEGTGRLEGWMYTHVGV